MICIEQSPKQAKEMLAKHNSPGKNVCQVALSVGCPSDWCALRSEEVSEDVSVMLVVIPQDTYKKSPGFMLLSLGREQYASFIWSCLLFIT